MSKDESKGTNGSAPAIPSDRTGFQPLNEGYVPIQKGYVPKPQTTATKLPAPPKGGTGVTSTTSQVSSEKE
jgi:hypothetical protein